MKTDCALIICGGDGTRLRPLTLEKPKPLISFLNKPMIEHQIDALIAYGVSSFVLAMSENAVCDKLVDYALRIGRKHENIIFTFSREKTKLDTGGAVAYALRNMNLGPDKSVFVLNADIWCDNFQLAELDAVLFESDAAATIATVEVPNASKYGLITVFPDGYIERFTEKPGIEIPGNINAGLYVFGPRIINHVLAVNMTAFSLEKDVFQKMVAQKTIKAYAMPQGTKWKDLGTPADHLAAVSQWFPDCVIHPDAQIGENVKLNAACIGKGAVVGTNCVISNSIVLENARIGANCKLNRSLVAERYIMDAGTNIDVENKLTLLLQMPFQI